MAPLEDLCKENGLSEKTLILYYRYILDCIDEKRNLAFENIENIVLEKGFSSLGEAEEKLKSFY